MVHADPGGSRRRVEESVQDRPVGDRVGTVTHRLRLAIGRSHRARIQMIPPYPDRRRRLAAANELVDREAGLGPITEPEPADARREPLKRHSPRRKLEPALKQGVVREELAESRVDRLDLANLAGQRRPAERPDPTAEERPDIRRDKARICKRVLYSRLTG